MTKRPIRSPRTRRPTPPPWLLALLGALALAASSPSPARAAGPVDGDEAEAVFDEAWEAVRDHFWDRSHSGLDWKAVGEKYRPAARASGGGRALHAVINRMLAELGASHTVVIEGEVFRDHVRVEFENRLRPSVGATLVEMDGRLHVATMLEGGAAVEAGLRRGDEVVRIDGAPAAGSPRLLPAGSDPGMGGPEAFFIEAGGDETVRLDVRRRPGDERLRTIAVEPSPINQIAAVGNSVGVMRLGEHRVGYIHIWHVISPAITEAFDRALAGELAGVDGLVVDLRGRGGTPQVAFGVLRQMAGFEGPVVALIDGGSRSAKEVMAYRIRKRGIATLVGDRTQGAVLAGRFIPLSDGSVLSLAARNVDFLSDGVMLEGEGVAPDVWVEDRLPYSAGEDRILERGLEVMARRLEGLPATIRRWH